MSSRNLAVPRSDDLSSSARRDKAVQPVDLATTPAFGDVDTVQTPCSDR